MNYSLTFTQGVFGRSHFEDWIGIGGYAWYECGTADTHQSDTLLTLGLSRPQGHELCPTSRNREVHQKTLSRTWICD